MQAAVSSISQNANQIGRLTVYATKHGTAAQLLRAGVDNLLPGVKTDIGGCSFIHGLAYRMTPTWHKTFLACHLGRTSETNLSR